MLLQQYSLSYVVFRIRMFLEILKIIRLFFLPLLPLAKFGAVARRADTRSRRESRDVPKQCEDDINVLKIYIAY